MALTRELGEFVSGLDYKSIPAEGVTTAKRGFIDCVGVMFAGRNESVVGVLRSLGFQSGDEAQILFDQGRTTSQDAALLNATAAHALDYDDVGIDGHPSVVLVPAVLAEGERLGASGEEMIAAYVAGYEVWAELSGRDEDQRHAKGWHPTAVLGAVGAAAAAARLAKLDAGRAATALGIAASMSGGLVANFGSMTKPFQAGRAAQSGILAARLAAKGMTSSPDALEHRAGFLQAFSPAGRVRADGPIAAGKDWHILRLGLNVKRYPVCYALHRSIDGLLTLGKERKFSPDTVKSVELRIGKLQAGILRHSRPQTGLDAKFSAEFAAACALVAGKVGLSELTDDFVRSAQVQSLLPKVKVTTVDNDPDPDEPLFSKFDVASVTLADDSVLQGQPVSHALGHARNPIGMDELRAKFDDCVGAAVASSVRDALFSRLGTLECLSSPAQLYLR